MKLVEWFIKPETYEKVEIFEDSDGNRITKAYALDQTAEGTGGLVSGRWPSKYKESTTIYPSSASTYPPDSTGRYIKPKSPNEEWNSAGTFPSTRSSTEEYYHRAKEAEIILLGKTATEWALIEHENIELKAKVQELEKFIEGSMEELMEGVKDAG